MLIISFSWTVQALLAGHKSRTRRNWNDGYAMQFKAGQEVQGWDRLPRAGGRPVALIVMSAEPYLEPTSQMTEADYEAEGLLWMEQQGIMIRGKQPREFFEEWKMIDEVVYVVRFQLLKTLVPLALYLPGGSDGTY